MTKCESVFDSLHPNRWALLTWLCQRIDDRALLEIANADCGYDADAHLAALHEIRQLHCVPAPLKWEPHEVLALTRWGTATTEHEHLVRAFACSVLLVAAADDESRDHILSENETIIQLISSVMFLGSEPSWLTVQLLAWRTSHPPHDEELPFFGLGILILLVSLRNTGREVLPIQEVGSWLVETEAETRRQYPPLGDHPHRWLLGLVCHDQCHSEWERVAKDVLIHPPSTLDPKAAEFVRSIGTRLLAA